MNHNFPSPRSGTHKRRVPGARRAPRRDMVSTRIRVLRELLDQAHARIRALERALARLIARL